jgi:hypothetical protein
MAVGPVLRPVNLAQVRRPRLRVSRRFAGAVPLPIPCSGLHADQRSHARPERGQDD